MNKNLPSLKRLISLFMVSFLALSLSACDSSQDDFVTGNSTLSLAGQYLGANNLANNQTSNLDVTVANNGNATGTLTVLNPVAAQTITAGPYPVTGSVNLTTGTFTLTGTFPGVGNFTITGTIPSSGNVGNYTITINGQTFNGVIQPASAGQPNPPNGNNNGGGNGNSQLIQGGTLSNFTFTPNGNYNGDNPPVDAMSGINGSVGEGNDGSESATIVISNISGVNPVTARTFIVNITVPNGEDLQVGTTYNLVDNAGRGAVLSLTDSQGVTPVEGWAITAGTTGSATITARDTNSITIDFNFSNLGPNTEINGNPATGTFSASGTVTGNFANIP